MAKKNRRFRGFGYLPGLSTIKSDVKGLDVLAGLGVGFVGVVAAKYARAKWMSKLDTTVPNYLLSLTPVVGGLVAGLVAYAAQKKGNQKRGSGHLLGAAIVGTALTADVLIRDNLGKATRAPDGADKKALLPFYNGIEDFGALVPDSTFGALQRDSYGALVQDTGYAGSNEIEEAIGY